MLSNLIPLGANCMGLLVSQRKDSVLTKVCLQPARRIDRNSLLDVIQAANIYILPQHRMFTCLPAVNFLASQQMICKHTRMLAPSSARPAPFCIQPKPHLQFHLPPPDSTLINPTHRSLNPSSTTQHTRSKYDYNSHAMLGLDHLYSRKKTRIYGRTPIHSR